MFLIKLIVLGELVLFRMELFHNKTHVAALCHHFS